MPARRKRDPTYVPKPPNAFLCFRRKFGLQFKAAEAARRQKDGSSPAEAAPSKAQQKNLSVEAGKVWRAMTAEEQAPYFEEAAERKREHERKHGKGSSAGKEAAATSRKSRAGKGGDPAPGLDVPTASSSLHRGHGTPGPSTVATSSYALPVPTSIHPFDHENGWSSPFAPSDNLLPTPALTPCHTLSPSPGPSLYSFPPSANVSRVASPAELDFVPDGTFYPALPHAPMPMAPLTVPGDYLCVPEYEYQLYDEQLQYNACAPFVPHHLGYVPYPAPAAEFSGVFPDQFAGEMIPIPHSMSLGMELDDAAQAGYTCQWAGELVDQAPSIPVADLAVTQDVWHQVAQQSPAYPGTAAALSLDWWIAEFGPVEPSSSEVIAPWD